MFEWVSAVALQQRVEQIANVPEVAEWSILWLSIVLRVDMV